MRRYFFVFLGIAGAGLITAIAANVLPSSEGGCTLPKEESRALDLGKSADRSHLSGDLVNVRRVASRYREYARTIPLRSDSVSARATYAGRPDRAYRYCLAILTDQVGRTHHLDAAWLQRQVSGNPPEKERVTVAP